MTLLNMTWIPVPRQLDYEVIASIARETKPRMIICGYSAYSRVIDFAAFRAIADDVGAVLMADIAHIAGLVAGGVASFTVSTCAYRDDHDPQDTQGPTWWTDPL